MGLGLVYSFTRWTRFGKILSTTSTRADTPARHRPGPQRTRTKTDRAAGAEPGSFLSGLERLPKPSPRGHECLPRALQGSPGHWRDPPRYAPRPRFGRSLRPENDRVVSG